MSPGLLAADSDTTCRQKRRAFYPASSGTPQAYHPSSSAQRAANSSTVLGKRRDSGGDADWSLTRDPGLGSSIRGGSGQPEWSLAKRARIADVEVSQVSPSAHVPGDDESDDEDDTLPYPQFSVIKMPLSLRAQAFLQDAQPRDHRRGDYEEVPSNAGGSSSNAMVLYSPGIRLGNGASEPVQMSAEPSAATMDVD